MRTVDRTIHPDRQTGLLIDRVLAAADSEQNRRRLARRRPTAIFGLEEPICWTKLFGFDANRYFSDPVFYFDQALKQKLWRWEHFPHDHNPITATVPATLGFYPEYTLVGMDVSFTAEGVPVISKDHPLTRRPDLSLLNPVDFKTSGWMPRILKWFDDLLAISAGRIPVRLYEYTGIWWRGGLDLAIELRGYENIVIDVIERPQFIHDLMRWLVEQRCRWYEQYYRHFGLKPQPVFIADDWINIPFITPSLFADFVLPRYLEIERFHGGITSIHSCGNQVPVQSELLKIQSLQEMEISPWSDLQQSLANIPASMPLRLTLHANDVLYASADAMRRQMETIAAACRGRSYLLATSGLTPETGEAEGYITKIQTWTQIADSIFGSGL